MNMQIPRKNETKKGGKLSFGFVLLPNFTLSAVSTFLDVIRVSADVGTRSNQNRASWCLLSEDGKPVRSSCGVVISELTKISSSDEFDYLCLVGGILPKEIETSNVLRSYFESAGSIGTTIVGLCTGTIHLVRMGLMENRPVGVSWYHQSDLLQYGSATVNISTNNLYVISNRRICCTTTNSCQYAAAWIVAKELGQRYADKALKILGQDKFLPPNHVQQLSGSASQYTDDIVVKTITVMQQNITYPMSIEEISSFLNVSVRTLNRRFKTVVEMSPKQYYLTERLKAASHLLRKGSLQIYEVAAECGFESPEHFCRSFKAAFAQTPSEFRTEITKVKVGIHTSD